MFPRNVFETLWGDLNTDEIKKFGVLGIILMFILGNYWTMRPLKNAFFKSLVGYAWQPRAKMLSVLSMVLLVLIYSKLVDLFEKQKIFYLLCTFYGLLFIVLGYCAANPHVVTLSTTSSLYPYISWIPGKALGWFMYIAFESFGSLLVTLFWAFVASTTQTESAKRGYAFVIVLTQIGTIIGPLLVAEFAETLGAPFFVTASGVLVLLIPFLVRYYMSAIPQGEALLEKKKVKTGFLEGVKLIFTKPYVAGILVVSAFYEVISIIVEFQMNMLADRIYLGRDAFAVFNAKYGVSVNVLAMMFALVGTSFIMRRFGLQFCLISFPALLGFIVSAIFIIKQLGIANYPLMWVLFMSGVAIKGLNYALNNPTKEVMYIPTSKDVKFKAKGWIDTFGNRSMKGAGAIVTDSFSTSLPLLLIYGTVVSLGIIGIWIIVALFVGKTFNRLQQEDTILE